MAEYYISPTGSDSTGNGTSGNPWLTVTKFDTVDAAGDVLWCKDGTYTMNYSFSISPGRTMKAVNRGLAIFDAGGTSQRILIAENGSPFPIIEDLVFTGASMEAGISFLTCRSGATFNRCVFRDITVSGGNGLQGGGLVSHHYGGTATFGLITFNSCLIYNLVNAGTGGFWSMSAKSSATASVSVYNCTFDQAKQILVGVSAVQDIGTFTSVNCIYRMATSQDFKYADEGLTKVFNNNCTYNYTDLISGNNNLDTDPLFIDQANHNYRLRGNSPCVATGTVI